MAFSNILRKHRNKNCSFPETSIEPKRLRSRKLERSKTKSKYRQINIKTIKQKYHSAMTLTNKN